MEQPEILPDLEEIWCEQGLEDLCCCVCGKPIGSAAPIRTFRLDSPGAGPQTPTVARRMRALGEEFVIYNRHLQCMPEAKYVAVSHVWNHDVSSAQARGRHSPQHTEARRHAFAIPIAVYHGLTRNLNEGFELWHDYISVPQWQEEYKERILGVIPKIFSQAHFTLVHLDDVTPQMVHQLRHGTTSQERLSGVIGICNAQWFSRVWTAMEFVRSRNIKLIIANHQMVQDANMVFLGKMAEVWDHEVKLQGGIHKVEEMVGMGRNMVPWNLGPLQPCRERKVVDFGLAFALLSRRGCRSNQDFFHALRGIVKSPADQPISKDPMQACLDIAMDCIKSGDYSPLLMPPNLGEGDFRNDRDHFIRTGFNDVFSWGLGQRMSPPSCHESFFFRGPNPVLELENIGVIHFIRKLQHGHFMFDFVHTAQMVLNFTGPNVDEFVETLGLRLYSDNKEAILKSLSQNNQKAALEASLRHRYNSPSDNAWPMEGPGGAAWIANVLGLSDTTLKRHRGLAPLQYLDTHGGTIHLGHFQALVAATCLTCHGSFVFRAALYKPPSEVRNAIAYRIPGLKYNFSLAEGVGVLVKDGSIVGRLLWATPACPCRKREMVELSIGELPLPMPRDVFLAAEDQDSAQ